MNKTFKKPIQLLPGNTISHKNNQYVITNIIDLESVLAKNIETKQSQRILVQDITPETIEVGKNLPNNLELINDDDWVEANRRFQIIKPILDAGRGQRVNQVKSAAKLHEISQATIYRWIATYEIEKRVSALVRPTRKDKGSKRTDPKVEEIIQSHIAKSHQFNH